MPVACQHCEDAPCVKVCPVGATFRRDDGVGARRLRALHRLPLLHGGLPVRDPRLQLGRRRAARRLHRRLRQGLPHDDGRLVFTPDRPRGVVEKCTLCVERIDVGEQPFCVEVCPVGARIFGDLNDPESEVSQLVERGGRDAAAARSRHRSARLLPPRRARRKERADGHPRRTDRTRAGSAVRTASATAWLAALGLLVFWGIAAWIYQLTQGLIATGMRDVVSWGLYIFTFAFFVGLSAGGLIMASAAEVFGVKSLRPLSRLGVLTAAACVLVAAMTIIPDLGNPQRVLGAVPLPELVVAARLGRPHHHRLLRLRGRRPGGDEHGAATEPSERARALRMLAYAGLPDRRAAALDHGVDLRPADLAAVVEHGADGAAVRHLRDPLGHRARHARRARRAAVRPASSSRRRRGDALCGADGGRDRGRPLPRRMRLHHDPLGQRPARAGGARHHPARRQLAVAVLARVDRRRARPVRAARRAALPEAVRLLALLPRCS